MSVKAELKGHEFDLDALVHLFPSARSGSFGRTASTMLAEEIDNRRQGVQYYEVAPKVLKTVNGFARVARPGVPACGTERLLLRTLFDR